MVNGWNGRGEVPESEGMRRTRMGWCEAGSFVVLKL